jgi:hypothetical protein
MTTPSTTPLSTTPAKAPFLPLPAILILGTFVTVALLGLGLGAATTPSADDASGPLHICVLAH